MTLNDKHLEKVCGTSEKLSFLPQTNVALMPRKLSQTTVEECSQREDAVNFPRSLTCFFFTLYSAVDSKSCDTGMIFYSVSVILDLQPFIVLFMRFFTPEVSVEKHICHENCFSSPGNKCIHFN